MRILMTALLLLAGIHVFGQGCIDNTHSLRFNGVNDFVNLNDLDMSGSYSGELWFKVTAFSQASILSKHSNGVNLNYLLQLSSTGQLAFKTRLGGYLELWSDTLSTNLWYHAAWVIDTSNITVSLYLNGTKVDSITRTSVAQTLNNRKTNAGRLADNPSEHFKGYIDEIRIWNRALTKSEINSKMSIHLDPSSETDLRLYLRFNEGAGTSAFDSSGNNDTATISGAAWVTDVPFTSSVQLNSSFTASDTSVCEGDTVNFINTTQGSLNYTWLENGVSFDSSFNSSRVFTTAGAYTIELVVDSANCTKDTSEVIITVDAAPVQPTVSQAGSILGSSNATSFQWYLNGNVISGATSQFYTPTITGFYTVEITDANGCSSISDPFAFNLSGINEISTMHGFSVYPNPMTSSTTIYLGNIYRDASLRMYNIFGTEVVSIDRITSNKIKIERGILPSGIYFYKIIVENRNLGVGKIAIE